MVTISSEITNARGLGALSLEFCHGPLQNPLDLGRRLVVLGLVASESGVRPEDVAQAIALGAAIRRITAAAFRREALDRKDIATINSFADEDLPRPVLGDDGRVRRMAAAPVPAAFAAVARDAIELLEMHSSTLRICEGALCEVVFADHSRNKRRRWCSMAGCGNRAKARAFRTRGHNLTCILLALVAMLFLSSAPSFAAVSIAPITQPDKALLHPASMVYDADDNLYVALPAFNCVDVISPTGVRSIAAGSPSGDAGFVNGSAQDARFSAPWGLAIGKDGDLYVADSLNRVIRVVTAAGVTTFAGTGAAGTANGPRLSAEFTHPTALAMDDEGNLFVADGNTIRRISVTGEVTSLHLEIHNPHALAVGGKRALFVSDDRGLTVVLISGVVLRYPNQRAADERSGLFVRFLEGQRPIGHAFALAALDKTSALYTDPQNNTVGYVVAGMDVGWIVARDRAVLRQATALAAAPDGRIAIAGGEGEIAWLDGLELRKPLYPAAGLFPNELLAAADDFTIAYVGNSAVWWDTSWEKSIEGELERGLHALAPSGAKPVRVFPVIMPGGGLDAGEQYLETLADAGLLREAILTVNPGAIALSLNLSPFSIGRTINVWEAHTVAGLKRLKKTLDGHHVPLVVILQPDAYEFYNATGDAMRPLPSDLRRAGIKALDLYPVFLHSPERADLFGTPDTHMTSLGRKLVAVNLLHYLNKH